MTSQDLTGTDGQTPCRFFLVTAPGTVLGAFLWLQHPDKVEGEKQQTTPTFQEKGGGILQWKETAWGLRGTQIHVLVLSP